MQDPIAHYVTPRRKQFFVAVDDNTGAIVGTVAVQG
jgi:hypothetical protein